MDYGAPPCARGAGPLKGQSAHLQDGVRVRRGLAICRPTPRPQAGHLAAEIGTAQGPQRDGDQPIGPRLPISTQGAGNQPRDGLRAWR